MKNKKNAEEIKELIKKTEVFVKESNQKIKNIEERIEEIEEENITEQEKIDRKIDGTIEEMDKFIEILTE